jgi:hypothetical protein
MKFRISLIRLRMGADSVTLMHAVMPKSGSKYFWRESSNGRFQAQLVDISSRCRGRFTGADFSVPSLAQVKTMCTKQAETPNHTSQVVRQGFGEELLVTV